MNYIKELKAFRDWLLLNDLPTSAIALWHTLMAINNMTGWKERFNAPNSTVEKLTGLSKQGLVDARKKLIENGLIEYEKGKKGKAPTYKMVSLVNSLDQYSYQLDDQYTDQSTDQFDDQSLTIPKHKQKQNETKNVVVDNNAHPETILIRRYMDLAAITGFDIPEIDKMAVRQVLQEGVPLEKALSYLEECFRQYNPKHPRDKINSFRYCATFILNKYFAEKGANHGTSEKIHQYCPGNGRPAKENDKSITGGYVGRIRTKKA
ncbi:hypothetical protein C0971_10135 [Bacillus methanolicus]|uniref:helix-turn-helix domain-containing protein n=1 Tax=Bacillus methanolicus TaxID=1471 RepID=UPI00200F3C67|nr:helix-turn-helix domain-containing protein [Bacillus methanolicus]UQD52331.1 hypothetical protein C0971_10135 [Bacillus methanolicus]